MQKDAHIYLDYMATTPVDPAVALAMQTCLQESFGNPASQHVFGAAAREFIHVAAGQVASVIGADASEIQWTSGATESINLALKGAAQFYQRQGRHLITMTTEHKAVLETCRYLETQGFDVTYLAPDKCGLLSLALLEAAIRPDTMLCSIMHVNNETGVIQDIEKIGALLKKKGVLFHVDAAQSAGKLPIDVKKMQIDLLSLSAHKIYGPKGIGALYVRRQPRVQIIPQMQGGEGNNILRAGTLATHQIVGMGVAFALAAERRVQDEILCRSLRDLLWDQLKSLPGISLNVDLSQCVSHCLNIRIANIDAKQFLEKLSFVGFSMGSACNAVDPEPSHVLMAMGLSREAANQSFRFSVGRMTMREEIMRVSAAIHDHRS